MAVESHLLRITCGRCDATWAGADRAHCAVCHRTHFKASSST
ncbi:FDXHR family putative zinc-binding protein [Pseudonocardia sp. Cha107L01]